MNKPRLSWHTGAIGAGLATVAGLVFLILPVLQTLTHLSYDLPFLFRKDVPVDGVRMVCMDVESEERLGQGRWDKWDRSLHARLIQVLSDAGARVVAFDLVFRRGTDENANTQLVQAARSSRRVAVGAMREYVLHEGNVISTSLLQPFPQLAEVAAWGMGEAADDTGAIREHVYDSADQVPSLAWRVAEMTMSPPPTNPYARRWVNYYGPNGFIPHVSYADVLQTNFPAAATFSNQVVFVGAWWSVGFTGGKGTDDYRTPHTLRTGRRMAGVEICATTYLNLVRGDWLSRLPPFQEAGLIALSGLLAGFALALPKPVRATWIALVLMGLVSLGAVMLTWQTRVWFPWLIVVAAQIPTALGVSVLYNTRELQRSKRALEQTLAMARSGSSPESRSAPAPAEPTELDPAAAPRDNWSPVGIGSSARPSGPSAVVGDLVQASAARASRQPTVPDHELIRCIGRGAYGEVWLGRDIIGSYHAIKLVFRDRFKETEPFDREFHGLRRFTPISRKHPGLVHVLQVGRNEPDGYLYYVMELGDDKTTGQEIQPSTYAARTLASDLQQRPRMRLADCLEVSIHLANTLEFLHQQHLIHRDIKPSNVIFVSGVAKFADIGLVTDVASAEHDVTYLGTKGYIAPEGPGTPSADVFSLGKVIYQMGFGMDVSRFPELPTSMVMDPDESALFGLNHVVMKACESAVAARYQTAAELSAALARLKGKLRTPSS